MCGRRDQQQKLQVKKTTNTAVESKCHWLDAGYSSEATASLWFVVKVTAFNGISQQQQRCSQVVHRDTAGIHPLPIPPPSHSYQSIIWVMLLSLPYIIICVSKSGIFDNEYTLLTTLGEGVLLACRVQTRVSQLQ